jgi:hypothetical protein
VYVRQPVWGRKIATSRFHRDSQWIGNIEWESSIITISEQIDYLNFQIQEFVACINSLPASLFLKEIDSWAVRDIVAHLIGWNRHTIEGCQQIRKREIPFYFIDAVNDFSKINEVSVQKYDSKNKQKLIDELETSFQELRQFLLTLTPIEWEADYGVRYKGAIITIKNTINELVNDYILHRQQINGWAKGIKSANRYNDGQIQVQEE